MSEIRLAYPIGRLAKAGAEKQMIALTGHLTQNGFSVDFVLRAGAGPLDAEARASGGRIRRTGELSTPDTPAWTVYARRLGRNARWIRTARQRRYDIVDAWLYPTDVVAALTRPLTRSPVVMSARLGRTPRRRFGWASVPLDAVVNRLTDMVVANSEISAADAVAAGARPERVQVIRGGVRMPPSFGDEQRRSQRATLGAGDEHLLIGCVGNFRSMKRHDLLIDAFARLLPAQPNLRLVLVGDGDLRPQIEQQIERQGLDEHVVLTGSISDMPPLYDALDLFVQASNSEGLPNVLLEASAAGLPIVATAAGGSGEVIHDGETGLLVPVDDLDRLSSAMHALITDSELRRRLGSSAQDLIERDYGMERFFREYADLYRGLVTARGGKR